MSLLLAVGMTCCVSEETKHEPPTLSEVGSITDTVGIEESPREMLKQAYQYFKEGNDSLSIRIAQKVLVIGRETDNDTLVGDALSSLCRNAQRTMDTSRLAELSAELEALAESSGDQKWMMKRAHMNAEMWRLVGDLDRAEAYYDESMRISSAIGASGMFMIDHFNKSFVSTAKGNFAEANELIKKYYELRKEADPESEDAYGLIALAYLLEQKGNYAGAHEVALVTRRLFEEQNVFPEPPDEKPLIAVEEKVQSELDSETMKKNLGASEELTVTDLLEKYLE